MLMYMKPFKTRLDHQPAGPAQRGRLARKTPTRAPVSSGTRCLQRNLVGCQGPFVGILVSGAVQQLDPQRAAIYKPERSAPSFRVLCSALKGYYCCGQPLKLHYSQSHSMLPNVAMSVSRTLPSISERENFQQRSKHLFQSFFLVR